MALISSNAMGVKFANHFEADLPNPAVNITKDENGNFIEVTVNEWHDSVYTKEGNKNYIFHQGYDYSRKEGFIRTYTSDKKLVNENYSNQIDGMVVREEMMIAFELFKKHPMVKKLLEQHDETITLHGGFNFEDDNANQPCFPGNRCVHVFASSDSKAIVAHSIVKLADQTVPYPAFDTDEAIWAENELKMQNIRKNRGKL